jgi:hypothetical protein
MNKDKGNPCVVGNHFWFLIIFWIHSFLIILLFYHFICVILEDGVCEMRTKTYTCVKKKYNGFWLKVK